MSPPSIWANGHEFGGVRKLFISRVECENYPVFTLGGSRMTDHGMVGVYTGELDVIYLYKIPELADAYLRHHDLLGFPQAINPEWVAEEVRAGRQVFLLAIAAARLLHYEIGRLGLALGEEILAETMQGPVLVAKEMIRSKVK